MTNKLKTTLRLAVASGFFNLPTGTFDNSKPNGILPEIANRVATFLQIMAWPLAFVGLIYSAYILISSAGNPDAWTKAKKNVGYIATGIFLLVFTVIIFNFFSGLFSK